MVCSFCTSKKAKPRAYHFAGQTALVSTCDYHDSDARRQLALAESKISLPCDLGHHVVDEHQKELQRGRNRRDARTPEDWERIRAKDRARDAAKKRRKRSGQKRLRSVSAADA